MIHPAMVVLMLGAGAGFIAGKLDLDQVVRDAVHNQNMRLAQLNAKAMADELQRRKISVG
jgi:anti-sigma factor RsiW